MATLETRINELALAMAAQVKASRLEIAALQKRCADTELRLKNAETAIAAKTAMPTDALIAMAAAVQTTNMTSRQVLKLFGI